MKLILVVSLILSAALALGYRAYRYTKGGPKADVTGGIALAVLLGVMAVAIGVGAEWARWPALAYGLLFALVVMPVWILGVYIPLRPGALDHTLIGTYYVTLVLIAVSALAL